MALDSSARCYAHWAEPACDKADVRTGPGRSGPQADGAEKEGFGTIVINTGIQVGAGEAVKNKEEKKPLYSHQTKLTNVGNLTSLLLVFFLCITF